MRILIGLNRDRREPIEYSSLKTLKSDGHNRVLQHIEHNFGYLVCLP